MPSEWFNVPDTGDGTEEAPYTPDYVGGIAGIEGFAGQRIADQVPRYIVRVFGTQAALDELASQQGVGNVTEQEVTARLEQATGRYRSRAEWNDRFHVRGSV